MARDPHSTPTNRPTAGVWRARIRSDAARRRTGRRGDSLDPLLRQRLEEAAAAAAAAADRASRAARAVDHAVDLATLMKAFGAEEGAGPEELLAAAGQSVEAAVEARETGARASTQGHLAKIAAQDEAAAEAPRLQRHAGLGELWHR